MKRVEFRNLVREIINEILQEKDEKWMQSAFSKNKGALRKQLNIPEDEKLSLSRLDSEINKLKAKTKKGEKLTKDELTKMHRLVAARNAIAANK